MASLKLEFRDNVCRGCLVISAKELSPIDDKLFQSYREISKIIIPKDSKLPHKLCEECLKSLIECVNFQNKCLHANMTLSKLLQRTTSNNGQFDLNNLRKEREKLLRDNNSSKSPKTHLDISKNSLEESNHLYSIKAEENIISIHKDNVSVEFSHDEFNHASPEEIYEVISTNFFIIDSLLIDPLSKDGSLEDSKEVKQDYKDDSEIFEDEFDTALSPELISPNVKNETDEIIIEIQENSSCLFVNDSKGSKRLKKRKKLPGQTDIQRALENSLQRRALKNNMKTKRNSSKKTNGKKSPTDIYCPFDEDSVNIVKLTLAEQMAELEAARASKRYLEAPYKCEMCAKGFVHELTLESHSIKHKESAGSFVCGICQLRYVSLHSLRNHHLAVHEERLECKQCEKVLSGRSSMAQHVAKHRGLSRSPACKICGKISNSPTSHYRHVRSHQPVPYKCTQCPRIFKDKSNLLDHVTRVHSGVKHFACEICHYSFATKTGLKAHSVKHSNRRDFYCVECDMNFKTQASLTHHLNASSRHANPDYLKFQCDQCDKRYDTALKLKLHVECSHLHIYKYACEQCPSKFQTSGALKLHRQRTHEGKVLPKKHACNLCDKAFTYRTTLMNHILIHTGEQPHVCDICSRPFRQKAAMQTHIKLVHLKIKRNIAKRKGNKAAITNDEKV